MCPCCESGNTEYGFWNQIIIYVCLDCGYEWEQGSEE
jgi:uncharacterized Zn ribbon protein